MDFDTYLQQVIHLIEQIDDRHKDRIPEMIEKYLINKENVHIKFLKDYHQAHVEGWDKTSPKDVVEDVYEGIKENYYFDIFLDNLE